MNYIDYEDYFKSAEVVNQEDTAEAAEYEEDQ